MRNVQTITIGGALAGPNYIAAIGVLQQAGLFTASQDFEILGYQANFSMQMDYSTVPPVFPFGALLYNTVLPRVSIPVSNVQANQNSYFLCVLQAMGLSQPAAAYAGAPAQVMGANAVSFTFPPGQPLKIATGASLAIYLGLAGVSAFNSAMMQTVLFINQ